MAFSSWWQDLIARYESGASNQFLLFGNVEDEFLLQDGRVGTLRDFLLQNLLSGFDVVLSYDLGSGLRIEKGAQTFALWPAYKANPVLPREPRPALDTLTHYGRFAANLARVGQPSPRVAVVVGSVQLLAPASPGGVDHETGALALIMREWSRDTLLHESAFASFLIAENLNDVHSLMTQNPRAARFKVPLPNGDDLTAALDGWVKTAPTALEKFATDLPNLGRQLAGSSIAALDSLLKTREFAHTPLEPNDVSRLKKELVEADAGGLIEFLSPTRTLDDLYGQEKVKAHLRADIALWRKNEIEALPKGYLLCGPVGTGKTFLVECLAGEAGVPVVKLKNFRDRWIGSTEGNLEKIFRLLGALGRCYVFVDEADQTLGKRDSGSGDSGISGRVYGMFAEEMSRSDNRGKIIWILASSRPDLIEVDLKRPGRIDVKIPLLPTTTPEESFQLIRNLLKRRGLELAESDFQFLKDELPLLLTPGAAEALSVKVFRDVKVDNRTPLEALRNSLTTYRPPVAPEVLGAQIELAVRESSDLEWVPESLRPRT
ncbi:ATP-dependent zinc metalloprotease FtsH 3 [Abditibacteriota bacterium]|nr:ATP-dependent zinc metalloprotease FtsH 3 [Abditibacteriota bacterium]